MKNLVLIILTVVLFSCNSKPVDYVSLKGTLPSKDVTSILVLGQNYTKDIAVDSDGKFSDTLNVADGMYRMTIGKQNVSLFLKNGYDLELQISEASNAELSTNFMGTGSVTNNYIEEKKSFFISDYADPKSYFKLDKPAYEARVSEAKELFNSTKIDVSKVDTSVVSMVSKSDKMLFTYVEANYERMHESAAKLVKGAVSPVFTNYENFAGGTTSLEDLKGKFVYIDIWATWCGPCKKEIPSLKVLENDFHGKNIEFVSISVDNVDGRRGSRASWLEMVKGQQLGGIQLFADKDFRSQFIQDYGINSIPRFILIDPSGNIVEANAMRPSDPQISAYFKGLGI